VLLFRAREHMGASSGKNQSRRIALADIDDVVSARLGETRVPGNAQPAAFNCQIAMFLANRVGAGAPFRSVVSNGRDHSTVIHSIRRIEALREREQLAISSGFNSGTVSHLKLA
jgi:chromosomal replication initiation ATPase DnaA